MDYFAFPTEIAVFLYLSFGASDPNVVSTLWYLGISVLYSYPWYLAVYT